MTQMIKISLFGLAGSGKTTTLKCINPECYIMSEQLRDITPLEAKFWDEALDTKVESTIVPNFGYLALSEEHKILGNYETINNENKKKIISMGEKPKDLDCCGIIDTCGQEIFFNLTKSCIDESNGLIFVIDSTIPFFDQKDDLVKIFANVMSNFNEYIPMVVLLNKQDILQKKKTEREKSEGYDGKAEQFRPNLRTFLPELKETRFFNTSADLGWNIKEAIESLLGKISERIVQEVNLKLI